MAFEGPDGSGKTTQRKLFKAWMRSVGHDVVTTAGTLRPCSPILKVSQVPNSLSRPGYCYPSAAAFRHQLDTEILPALWGGKVVVADQYLYTALARDLARGRDRNWVMNAYLPLFWPDQVFYFALSAKDATDRVRSAKKPGFYGAGQDVTNIADPEKSHAVFLGRVIQEYESLAKIFQFLKVDARQSIYEQHRAIRQMFMTAKRRPWGEWNTEAVLAWLCTTAGTTNGESGKEEREEGS